MNKGKQPTCMGMLVGPAVAVLGRTAGHSGEWRAGPGQPQSPEKSGIHLVGLV